MARRRHARALTLRTYLSREVKGCHVGPQSVGTPKRAPTTPRFLAMVPFQPTAEDVGVGGRARHPLAVTHLVRKWPTRPAVRCRAAAMHESITAAASSTLMARNPPPGRHGVAGPGPLAATPSLVAPAAAAATAVPGSAAAEFFRSRRLHTKGNSSPWAPYGTSWIEPIESSQ